MDDGSPIVLEADEIRYEPDLNTIIIKGNAKLSQEGSQVSGNKIVYNMLTEQLEAEGNLTDSVTTILQPQLQNEEKDAENSPIIKEQGEQKKRKFVERVHHENSDLHQVEPTTFKGMILFGRELISSIDPKDAVLSVKPALYGENIKIYYTDEEKYFEIDDKISDFIN